LEFGATATIDAPAREVTKRSLKGDELLRMVRAIDRTEKWVAKASGKEIAETIAGYFKDLPPAILEAASPRVRKRVLEFFGASIVNDNTRKAYMKACAAFFDFLEENGVDAVDAGARHPPQE